MENLCSKLEENAIKLWFNWSFNTSVQKEVTFATNLFTFFWLLRYVAQYDHSYFTANLSALNEVEITSCMTVWLHLLVYSTGHYIKDISMMICVSIMNHNWRCCEPWLCRTKPRSTHKINLGKWWQWDLLIDVSIDDTLSMIYDKLSFENFKLILNSLILKRNARG